MYQKKSIDFVLESLSLLKFSLGRSVKEEERQLGTSAWARHLNEASRITPQVKQYFKRFEHIFIGKRGLKVVGT